MHIDLNIASKPRTPYLVGDEDRTSTIFAPLPIVLLTTVSLCSWGLLAHLASIL